MSHMTERASISRSHRWIDARVRSRHQPEVSAIISHISEADCCIEGPTGFEAGEQIEIMVPRLGSMSAIVSRCEAGHSWAAFIPGSDRWLSHDPQATRYRTAAPQETNVQYQG